MKVYSLADRIILGQLSFVLEVSLAYIRTARQLFYINYRVAKVYYLLILNTAVKNSYI